MLRVCALCQAKDHPVILEDRCNCTSGDDLAGHATGCSSIQHFVAKDIKQTHLTPALERKGWRNAGIFQGKTAIVRLLCRDCIRKQDEVIEIEAYRKKCGQEAEGETAMDMYQILCT